MENLVIIVICLILMGSQALAVKLRRGPWNSAEDCDKVSFIETGRNSDREFTENEVSKGCYNIKSDTPTAAALVLNSLGCKYTVKTFPLKNCNINYDLNTRLHPLDHKNRAVHLNRLPICSFSIDFVPDDGTPVVVKFLESRRTSNFSVKQAKCRNICDGVSTFHYPDTVELYHKEYFAWGYYVNLFSKPGCNGMITNIDDQVAMETQGALDLRTITQLPQALSYEIYSSFSSDGTPSGFTL